MPDQQHEGDHKQPAPERQADRVERKSELKAGAEAAHGMEDRNKTIVAEILKKRHERKSGGTDQLNKDDHHGKRVASADELLPLDKPDKPPLTRQITEAPGQNQKPEIAQHKPETEPKRTEPPNYERANEDARKVIQTITSGGLYEGGTLLKGIKDQTGPVPLAELAEKTRFVPAGTPLEIRGHTYKLDELTAQNTDRASDARDKPKNNHLAGVPTIVGKDGVRRLDGHFQPEPLHTANPVETVAKAIEPVTNAISRFNTESTKALHNLIEHGKEAVGLNPSFFAFEPGWQLFVQTWQRISSPEA